MQKGKSQPELPSTKGFAYIQLEHFGLKELLLRIMPSLQRSRFARVGSTILRTHRFRHSQRSSRCRPSSHVFSLAISTKEPLTCSNPIMNTTSTMLADILSHGLAYHAISTRSRSAASSTTYHHSSILLISSIRIITESINLRVYEG